MLIADTLSRHHLDHTTDKAQGDEEVDRLGAINEILLCESTMTALQDHTASDAEIQLVQSFIQSGWPATSKDLDPTIVPYFHIRDELTIQDGIIFRGDRIVIPQPLQKQTLSDSHAAHQGIASTTRRARETVHWPHLNQELKDHIAGCPTCDQYDDKEPKQPLTTTKYRIERGLKLVVTSSNSKINHMLLRSITIKIFSKLTTWTA